MGMTGRGAGTIKILSSRATHSALVSSFRVERNAFSVIPGGTQCRPGIHGLAVVSEQASLQELGQSTLLILVGWVVAVPKMMGYDSVPPWWMRFVLRHILRTSIPGAERPKRVNRRSAVTRIDGGSEVSLSTRYEYPLPH